MKEPGYPPCRWFRRYPWQTMPRETVIRRVGGLEVKAKKSLDGAEVIRRVGGLKMFHHAHFSRSSAILPPGHWLLIQYMTSANSLRLKMREKRRSPVLTLCRLCG